MKERNINNKFTKWDYINILLLTIFFALIIWVIRRDGYLLGSNTDWGSQHTVFPEYFKALFKENHDLFPDLALQIGSGQNIYNFSYYGLFNPIIILSYFLPIKNMYNYILATSMILLVISSWLFYKFLRNHKYSSLVAFLGSIFFIASACMIYHMRRQIMFVNYMPFLVLGLMGVDKYFEKGKSYLLVLSTFSMIFMSYYFSVVGILVFIVYGIYVYLKKEDTITFKKFIIDGLKFLIPIFIGILISGILLIPTIAVILNGRSTVAVPPSLYSIITPGIYLKYILYKPYGIGLTSIVVFAIIYLFFNKLREDRFLGIILCLLIIFPFFNYIFNGMMYLDAKSLIPFLPICCLVITKFIDDLFNKNINSKKLKFLLIISIIVLSCGVFTLFDVWFLLLVDSLITLLIILLIYFKPKLKYTSLILIIFPFISTVYCINGDEFIEKDTAYGKTYKNEEKLVNLVTKSDNDIYRITNQIGPLFNSNRNFGNLDYYLATIYSSTYNTLYNDFYYDIINNPLQNRNTLITSSAKNYPFLLLTSHKYLLTKWQPFIGYQLVDNIGRVAIYKNENVLPLGYASSNIVSSSYFKQLGYPYNQEIILNNIVVKNNDITNKPESHVKKINLDLDLSELEDLNITYEDNAYRFTLDKDVKLSLPLKEPLKNTLLYVRINILENNDCDIGDTQILVNGAVNKLTCSNWKYFNDNYVFDYVVSYEEIPELSIEMPKGIYAIKNVEFYYLDASYISNLNDLIDPLIIDTNKTKGDIIKGSINVTKDGYFTLSIPYDKGFKVYVDNKLQDTEIVNEAFLGFPIKKGKHDIYIEYEAPGKKVGMTSSMSGLILYIGLILFDKCKGRKKNDRRIKK